MHCVNNLTCVHHKPVMWFGAPAVFSEMATARLQKVLQIGVAQPTYGESPQTYTSCNDAVRLSVA